MKNKKNIDAGFSSKTPTKLGNYYCILARLPREVVQVKPYKWAGMTWLSADGRHFGALKDFATGAKWLRIPEAKELVAMKEKIKKLEDDIEHFVVGV